MTTIISGHEAGLLDSSQTLLNRDDKNRLGSAGHGEQTFVNVSNGNLLIQQVDAYLPSQGEDYRLVRTYNSRGEHDDAHQFDDSGWMLSTTINLSRSPDLSRPGSQPLFEVQYGDGSLFVYQYDVSRGLYVTTDGAGAYETLQDMGVTGYTSPAYIVTRADQTKLYFDKSGHLLSSVDPNGVRIDYTYRADRLVKVQDDQGHSITYVYQMGMGDTGMGMGMGQLASVVDETGTTLVRYVYETHGRLSQVIDRDGHSTYYHYNAAGVIDSVTLPAQQVENGLLQQYAARTLQFEYQSVQWRGGAHNGDHGRANVLTKITDAEGGITTFDYHFQFDNKGNIKHALRQYDAFDDAGYFFVGGTTQVVDALGNNRAYSNDTPYRSWRVANGYYDLYNAVLAGKTPAIQAQVDAIRNAHSLTYTYDADGYLTQVLDQSAYKTTYTYDANDNLSSITDRNGYAATTSDASVYRALRAELGYVDAAGLGKLVAALSAADKAAILARYTTSFTYDSRGNVLTRTDNEGHVTTFSYTGFNKIASETSAMGNALATSDDPVSQQKRIELGYAALAANLSAADRQALRDRYTTRYTYDAKQNLISRLSPAGDLTAYVYDVYGNLITRTVYLDHTNLTDPARQQITRYSYDAYGNNVKTVDAEGASTFASFDHFGNRLTYTDGNGGVTRYTYDKDNRLITVTDPEGHVTVNFYDAVDNRIAVKDAAGHTVTYVYDRNNMLIATVDAALAGVSQDRITRYSYDVIGDRTTATDAEGRTTTYTYDTRRMLIDVATAQVADANGNLTQYHTHFAYDGEGHRIRITNNNGNTSEVLYSPDGLIRQQTDPSGHITRIVYDANHNQVTIIAGYELAPLLRQVVRFAFDEKDELITRTDAEGKSTKYTYDAHGNRIAVTDANGNTTEFQYDRNNRQLREIRPAVADPATGALVRYTLQHQYDANGNEIATTDENGHTTLYAFDKDNRAVLVTDANGIQTVYAYDSRHNRTSIQMGVQAHMDVNHHAVVDSVQDAQVTTFIYDEFNQLTAKTDGVGNALASSDVALYQTMRTGLGYAPLVANLSAANKQALQALYTERYNYDRVGNRTRVTDALGRATSFSVDALNRQVVRTDALGNKTAIAYDGDSNRVAQTDALGRVTRLSYDANDRLITSTDALGVVTQRDYNAFSNLVAETRAAGGAEARTTRYEYDLNNRLIRQTDAQGHAQSYEYDAVGNRLKITDAKGQATQFVYNALNRNIQIIDPLSFTTKLDYDGVGNRLSLIDAKGGITRLTYDAGNRRIEMRDAEGRVTHFTYDLRNNRISQTSAYGTPNAETTTYEYDAQNNLRAVIDAAGNRSSSHYDQVYNPVTTTDGNGHITSYAYDAINRQIRITDATGAITAFAYDAVGNRLSRTDALGRVTFFSYDARNQTISETAADGVVTQYAYDVVGNRVAITRAANSAQAATTQFQYNHDNLLVAQIDPLGNTTRYIYDANHNRTQVTDAGGNKTTYRYDADNRVVAITDALGNTLQYRYDGNGNRIQVIDARGYVSTSYFNADNEVATTVDNEGYAVSYVHDQNGNVVSQTLHARAVVQPLDPNVMPVIAADAQDRTTQFSYDKLNRLSARIDPEGYRTDFGYDAVGNRLQTRAYRDLAATDAAVTHDYYDGVNRVIASVSAEGYLTSYSYDAIGNRVGVTGYDQRVAIPAGAGVPSPLPGDGGRKVAYAFDANNRLVRETNALGVDTVYQYDARGNRMVQADAAGTPDQRVTQYRYDAADRLTDTVNALGVATHMQLDAVGNVQARYDAYGSADQRVTRFVYDGIHRVVQQVDALGITTTNTYDAGGNKVAQTVASGTDSRTETYRYNGNNQMVSTTDAAGARTDYAYDGAGNRIRLTQAPSLPEERSNTFEYNRDNRLVASTDAMGVRTEYRYDGAGNKLETTQAVGRAEQRHTGYVYDHANRLVQITDPMGAVTHYEYDALGNQVTIVNANGGVQHNTFDKLGRVMTSLSPGGVQTTNQYDQRGNVVSTTQSWANGSDARTTRYTYDLLDRQTRVTDAEGFSTSITYDSFGNQVAIAHGQYLLNPGDAGYDAAKAARAFVVTNGFVYDAGNRMLSMTDGVGTVTAYTYDGFGNRLTTTEAANTAVPRTTTDVYDQANRLVERRNPEGGIARYRYDAVGNKVGEDLLQSGDAATGVWIHKAFNYDANGHLTAETDPYGVRTEYGYDAMGNRLSATAAAGTADARTVRMEYDLDNRKTTDVDALGNRTTYAFDAVGNRIRVIDAEGRVAHYYYNSASQLMAVLDPEGYVNTFQYDSAGNQVETHVSMTPYSGPVTDYSAPLPTASATDRVTRITYNGINKEVARVAADGTTTLKTYDGAGNLATEILYANTSSPPSRQYSYDANNRLVQFTDVDGTVTTFGYDAANNKTREAIYSAVDPNHTRTTLYQYDLNNRKTSETFDSAGLNIVLGTRYDQLGNVVSKIDGNGHATTYRYDLNNRAVSETDAAGATKTRGYDRVGNVIRQTDARGNTTDFVYDGNNRLVTEQRPSVGLYSIGGGASSGRPTITHAYDAAGNEVQTVDANGNIVTRYYDGNNRLSAELNGDQALHAYRYNAAGDQVSDTLYMTRLGATDHNPRRRPLPPAGEARTITREYDLAGRLTRVVYPAVSIVTLTGTDTNNPTSTALTQQPDERNVYDAFGNKIAAFDKNGNRTLAYYDVKGRQVAVIDPLGYLTEFDYDAQDNVVAQRVYTTPLATAALTPGVRPVPPIGEVYVTNRQYDAASRVASESAPAITVYDPATGTSSVQRPVTLYSYDKTGNPLGKTLAAGTSQAITEYSYYDAANRRVAVVSSSRVLSLYQYDANGNATRQARFYNPLAANIDLTALSGASDFAALVVADGGHDEVATLAYDAGNHLSSQTDLMGPGSADDLIKSYQYDAAGTRTWVRDEDGYVSQTAYDAAGHILKTITADGSGTLVAYDAAGNQVYAYTGVIANATAPATNIRTTLSAGLDVAWDISGPQGTRSWVVYDSVGHADLAGYASRSAIQTNLTSASAQARLPAGTAGGSLYFRVVTQDAAGNMAYTAEQAVTIPPRFSAVTVSQTAPGTLVVNVRFDAGVQNPVLNYGAPGATTASAGFVLQADGSYQATISGLADPRATVFRLAWQDNAAHSYQSAEQPFKASADTAGISSTVSQGVVGSGAASQYTILVNAQVPSTLAQSYTLIEAGWRVHVDAVTNNAAYARTAVTGVDSGAGYRSYALTLADLAPLAAGKYDVVLIGVRADGTRVELKNQVFEVGPTSAAVIDQGLSWMAPSAGSAALAVIDGGAVGTQREAGRVLVNTALLAGAHAYDVYYTDARADTQTVQLTSTAVTQTIGNPPVVTVIGYDLGVNATFSAAETAAMSGGLHLAWRSAGTGAFSDVVVPGTGATTFATSLASQPAGHYDLKLWYTDTSGHEVIVTWQRLDTATVGTLVTASSQVVLARELGGSVTVGSAGLVSLDPGLYTGALDSAALQTSLALAPIATGSVGGSVAADGRTTGYYTETQYDALNHKIASNEGDGLWRTFGLDANGNALETRLYGDKAATHYISTLVSYDGRNREVKTWGAPAQIAGGSARAVTTSVYNVLDKLTVQTDALGNVRRYAYNALGTRVADTDANGNTETTLIDIFGNTTATVSRGQHTNLKFYDAYGRLAEERDATGRSTTYGYDAFDRRALMTDGLGQSARYRYDQRDRLTGYTTPLGLNTAYAYDGRNNRTTTTDALGNSTTQGYDALGRVWHTTSLQNGQPVSSDRGYDAYGNLVAETDSEGRLKTHVYAGFGRLIEEIDEDGNRFIKGYDAYGRLVSETSPQTGKSITRGYDDAGQLLSITDAATGVATVYTYDLDGRRVTETVTTPNNVANRTYTYSYDANGQMTTWHDAVTGLHLNLHYDAEGNLAETATDLGYNPTGANTDPNTGAIINPNYRYLDHVYTYDAARRLAQVDNRQVNAQGQAGNTLISAYTYDAAGNRHTWDNAGTLVTYTYDADHRVLAGTWTENLVARSESWTYDNNGNVLTFSTDASGTLKTTRNTFDEQNHTLTTDADGQVTTRTFDRSGRMTHMAMVQNGKTYSYDYLYFGDGRERGVNAFGDAHGNSSSTYDANLNRIAVNLGKGDGQDRPETKSMVVDNDGHILNLVHDDGKSAITEVRDYAYAQGNPVGEIGHGTDTTTNTVKLDSDSYSLVLKLGADTPNAAVTRYTTRTGDTLQGIAAAMYGNPSLWFVIADANGLSAGEPLPAGRQLTIPNHIQQGNLTADTHKLYNESEIVGSTLPNLVTPPPPSHGGGCGSILMIIIIVVIAVVVTIFTAGAGAALFGALGSFFGVATAGALTLGSYVVAALSYAIAGALVAAVGSIVQQGLFIALGYQEKFSWKQVGSAAVSGALSGAASGLGAVANIAAKAGTLTTQAASYVKIASAALQVSSVASKQLLDNGKITSWTSLAAAAVGGYAGAAKGIASAEANAVNVTNGSLQAATAAANTAQTLQTITNYVTPWAQLAETYVRNDGKLTPSDWAGAVGGTLATAVTVETKDPFASPTIAEQLSNAGRRLGANLLVAGALSHYDKTAAQGYMENAIGQEAGQFIATQVGKSLGGLFSNPEDQGPQRVYDPNKRAFVDRSGNEAVIPTVADNYLSSTQSDGERRNAYGNPIAPIVVADSGINTTDVAPGLLAGSGDANTNQTPSVESYKLKSGDSYWSIARNQLQQSGANPTDADIQRQVYALMELNPGLDPRTLQANQSINLITPNSGTSISSGTLTAYGASDADYQGYREAQAQLAQAREAMMVRGAYAESAGGGEPSTFLDRFIEGANEGLKDPFNIGGAGIGGVGFGMEKTGNLAVTRTQSALYQYAGIYAEDTLIAVDSAGNARVTANRTPLAAGESLSIGDVTKETRFSGEAPSTETRVNVTSSESAGRLTPGITAEAGEVRVVVSETSALSKGLAAAGKAFGSPVAGAAITVAGGAYSDAEKGIVRTGLELNVSTQLDAFVGAGISLASDAVGVGVGIFASAATPAVGVVAGAGAAVGTGYVLGAAWSGLREDAIKGVTSGIQWAGNAYDRASNAAQHIGNQYCLFNCR